MCNTVLFGIDAKGSPFDALGASHNKQYKRQPNIISDHFTEHHEVLFNSNIISIQISKNDLLPLSMISLLRAGNHNINNIDNNTYNKLDNNNYRHVLDTLIDSYTETNLDTYKIIKDEHWPDINTITDFANLPKNIKEECINIHQYYPFELTALTPDCPAFAIRDMFKQGFKNPDNTGFISRQREMLYDNSNNLLYFPYHAFYDELEFINEIVKVANFFNIKSFNLTHLNKLHSEFTSNQPYKFVKFKCDNILLRLYNSETINFTGLDILEESYIEAKLEERFSITFPLVRQHWFKDSDELYKCLKSL